MKLIFVFLLIPLGITMFAQESDSLVILGPKSGTIILDEAIEYDIDKYNVARIYHENNRLHKIGKLKGKGLRKRRIGIWIYFNEDGVLIKEEYYNRKGRLLSSTQW